MTTFQADLERARWDIGFFSERFLGIVLHPGQLRVGDAYLSRKSGPRWWIAAYLTICVSAGNRAGKTLLLAVIVLHGVIFKMGVKPPTTDEEALRWRTHPYVHYHFAIEQDVARLVFDELVNMLQGIHVAQKEGKCPLAEELPHVAEWTKKDGGEYDWIVLDASLGGGEIKFRTTKGNKGKGSLGRDMNGISFDECGLEPNLLWIVKNVIHLRRLGTGGQLFLFSTPEEGLTEFADMWFEGDPDQPDQKARHMSLRMSTRENIGYGLDEEMFDALVGDMDEDHVRQNIDGYFIQGRTAYFNSHSVDNAFVESMPDSRPAKNKGVYIQGVDPGLTDRCWSLVFEWRRDMLYGVKAEYSRSRTTEAIVALAVNNHSAYEVNRVSTKSTCYTAIDTTALGGHMFRELVQESLPDVISVEFGGNTQVKRKLLGDLKTMLDKGQVKMPRSGDWLILRRQLAGFKLNDRKIEQDAVMAMACAVKVTRRVPSDGQSSVPFDAFSVISPPSHRAPMDFRRPRRQSEA